MTREIVTGERVHAEGEQHFSRADIILLVHGKKHNTGQQKGSKEARRRVWTAGQNQDHSRSPDASDPFPERSEWADSMWQQICIESKKAVSRKGKTLHAKDPSEAWAVLPGPWKSHLDEGLKQEWEHHQLDWHWNHDCWSLLLSLFLSCFLSLPPFNSFLLSLPFTPTPLS